MAFSRARLGSFFLIVLAACEDAENHGVPLPDAGPGPSLPDAGAASSTLFVDAAPPSARDIEVGRMQAYLDTLYLQSDVTHRFTTAYGDDVDCVPFQKQPGFSTVGSMDGEAPNLATKPFLGAAQDPTVAGFGDGNDLQGRERLCPSGAVPIRHLGIADLTRFSTLDDFLAKLGALIGGVASSAPYVHQHAGYHSDVANWGAQTTLNVWDPAVEEQTFSLSQMWTVSGTGDPQETVETGYSRDRIRSGTGHSRLFIYSTRDGYRKTGCYDLTCKDFVQLGDSHILLGGTFAATSTAGGAQKEFTLRTQFCPVSQCRDWAGWWIRYEAGAFGEWIGFYPRKLFSLMADGAARLDFGGEVSYPGGLAHSATDMGSGAPPSGGFGQAAYQTNLRMITTSNTWSGYHATLPIAEKDACYTQMEMPAGIEATAGFFYGGTGLSDACR